MKMNMKFSILNPSGLSEVLSKMDRYGQKLTEGVNISFSD
jgi:hypothetical protein